MRSAFKVAGLSDMKAALEEFPKGTAKGIVRRVLRKAGKPIADQAEQLAPRDTGTTAKSITITSKLSKRQGSLHRKNDQADVEMFIGPGTMPQAHLREFGGDGHPPKPFMRPAWDSNKDRALETIKTEMWVEIQKSAARAAKRALKLSKAK